MYIKELHIAAFGPVCDRDLTFERGLNIIEGANESGKSAVAMFIKFIFYGLSSRAVDGDVSEKQRYVNWSRGYASGHAVCVFSENGEEKAIRVERTLNAKHDAEGRVKYSERVRVLDHETSMPLNISGQPGDFFFGVPEGVFMGSAFASQEGDIKPDGASLKESVENIICAADENINVKRAADVLDRARIRLLHKNRTGGEIRELESRRDELERRLLDTKDTSSRLIKAEISLADVKENIESAAKRRAELEALASAIELLGTEAKITKLAALEAKLTETRKSLSTPGGATDDSFMSSLAVAVRDIERAEKQRGEVELKKEALKANCGGRDDCDPELELAASRRSSKKANTLFYVGTVFLVLGLLGLIACAGLKFMNHALFLPAVAVTVAVVLAGTVVMVLSSVTRRRLYDILDAWDADDIDELELMCDDAEALYRDLENARLAQTSADLAAKEAEAVISSLAVKAGVPTAGVPMATLIKQLAKAGTDSSQRKKNLEAEASRIEGQLAETRASLAGVSAKDIAERAAELKRTRIGSVAAAMSDAQKSEVARELGFNRTKSENLRGRELDLERECAALRASAGSPATAAEELESLNDRIAGLRRKHDALILAGETLAEAGENIRSSVVPRLTDEASGIMERVTGGRYSAIGISPSFDMNFRDDAFGTLELDYLSAGTKDMAYVALRLALVKALYEETARPPMIFDESLASLDEDRVRTAVAILEDEDIQSFLFTCRSLEGGVATRATKTTLHRG